MNPYLRNAEYGFWHRPDFQGIAYSDGQAFERELLETVRNASDPSVFSTELSAQITDWRSQYHLTPQRHCLLRPIPFRAGESILELGCGCGAITRYLGECGLDVTAVEGGVPRASISAARCRDLPNVRVLLEDLVAFESEERYDWVTLIGVLEYSPTFAPGADPVLTYLKQAMRYLKPGGRLVLAIENRLGLKYFNGCGEDHVGKPFYGINDLYGEKAVITFGRAELEARLAAAGFGRIDFMYAFPDYKLPTVIVNEAGFAHEGFAVSDLLLRTDSRDYGGRSNRLFSEQLAARSLEDNGVLRDFANSFLILASPSTTPATPAPATLAWTYSVHRRTGYRTETSFEARPDTTIEVRKRALDSCSEETDRTTAALRHRICERADYVQGRLMAWAVQKAKLHSTPFESLCRAFEPYARHLLAQARRAPDADGATLKAWWLPGSKVDCTPFNLVQTASGPVEIDEEWEMATEIPAGWVLVRAIMQTVAHGAGPAALETITVEEVLAGVCARIGLRVDPQSIPGWLEHENAFLAEATGSSIAVRLTDMKLTVAGPARILDLDRPTGPEVAEDRDTPASPGDAAYHRWMSARAIEASDGAIFAEIIARSWSVTPRIHLLLRVAPAESARLADTLESLNYQLYGNWQVDIVATFPVPGEAFLALDAVGWHEIGSMDQAAATLNLLVLSRRCDWILELPAGAVLDPMCLMRIAHQINTSPASGPLAWYFDSDSIDARQIRRQPRFKPDFDPEWLLCADLLGPLCVHAQAWSDAGGAGPDPVRPWYDLALRLDEAAGTARRIGHLAEPLLSLPEAMQHDGHAPACAAAVERALLRRGIEGQVGTTSATTWRIDRSLRTPPSVTIAIPSRDKPEYLEACVHHLLASTHYPDYEILIVDGASQEADTQACLTRLLAGTGVPLRSVTLEGAFHLARFANAAAQAAHGEFLVLLADDVRAIQPDWLSRLVGHAARPGVACAGAVLVTPPEGAIDHAGYLPGLGGFIDSPHRGRRFSDEPGYLDLLRVDRTVAGVSSACLALRKADLITAGGMDESLEMATCAELDFCLRLARQQGGRCVVASGVQLARLGGSCLAPQDADPVGASERHTAELRAQQSTLDRWFDDFASSRFWSLHLDRRGVDARIETSLVPGWHVLPDTTPRILAFPVRSAQGDIRVVQPLTAARKAARAQACVYSPTLDAPEPPTVADLARHAPDVVLTHQWLGDPQLRIIRQMRSFLKQTFRVYELDDLVTDMPQRSSLRLGVPADARSHLARMLREFDRLVVSTDYLAERYGHLAREVRVVPNRLEGERWLKLPTQRCTSPRPRVGWAGGTAHEGDLQILADVIAATAHEIDWVFMGMCPDNLRPFLKEFHPFGPIADYPARLAALNLDLAVAPLEQIPFNRAKSNLRLLEYGVLGIPVICTDIDPYRDSPACRVPNEARAWLEALRARIHDPGAAAQEGQAMRDWVTRGFLLEDHVDAWLTAHLPD